MQAAANAMPEVKAQEILLALQHGGLIGPVGGQHRADGLDL
jgi:hypothetical protein